MTQPKLCVVGSSNYDLIAYTTRFPKPGETIFGHDFKMGCGGKGANQAVAAAKLGAHVTMVTKLGDDIFGKHTLENYKNLKINTDYISVTQDVHSGVAPIWVDKKANNSIIVIPGANNCMTLNEIENARNAIASAQILICQNEIPFSITQKALHIAKENKVTTIFNPAPAPKRKMPREFFKLIDILCLNETEAEILTHISIHNIKHAVQVGEYFLRKNVQKIIITLGKKGSVLVTKDSWKYHKGFKVKAIDTTGAGDCFVGSFAYFYAKGISENEAICKAQYIASCSVQKHGTQTSFPSKNELPSKLFGN